MHTFTHEHLIAPKMFSFKMHLPYKLKSFRSLNSGLVGKYRMLNNKYETEVVWIRWRRFHSVTVKHYVCNASSNIKYHTTIVVKFFGSFHWSHHHIKLLSNNKFSLIIFMLKTVEQFSHTTAFTFFFSYFFLLLWLNKLDDRQMHYMRKHT